MASSVHRVDVRNFPFAYGAFISVARSCRSPFVFLDSEFPGDIHRPTKHHTLLSPAERYALLKQNADAMRPIQFGITLSDGVSFSSTWQFDLRDFNLRYHPHAKDSIALLESAGIDLKRNSRFGIHSTSLARLLIDAGLVGLYSGATWVAFHGCYDFALLMKAMFQVTTRLPVTLPETLEEFMGVSRCLFGGAIYDVKCVMKHCEGLYGGLERVAKKLSVERAAGKAHQAGSDSLLTCHVFFKMKMTFFGHVDDGEEEKMPSEGLIFGING